jgi:hypothetical protein
MRRKAISIMIIVCLGAVVLGASLGTSASALAANGHSAGDSQYVDPLSGAGQALTAPSAETTTGTSRADGHTGTDYVLSFAVAVCAGLIGAGALVRRRVGARGAAHR